MDNENNNVNLEENEEKVVLEVPSTSESIEDFSSVSNNESLNILNDTNSVSQNINEENSVNQNINVQAPVVESKVESEVIPQQNIQEESKVEPVATSSESSKEKKSIDVGFIIKVTVVVLIFLGLAIGGYYLYDKYVKEPVSKPVVTKEKDKSKEVEQTKTKKDYFVLLDASRGGEYLDTTLGYFLLNGKKEYVRLAKIDDQNYNVVIGDIKIKFNATTDTYPSYIALMDESYVAMFFEKGSENKTVIYDKTGTKKEEFGNSLGEVTKDSKAVDMVAPFVVNDKTLAYYECEYNNGPGTQTLTEYNINFEGEKYTKEALSVKKNSTCLFK